MEIRTIGAGAPPQNEKLMKVAQALEASFLSEMLKSVGFGETPDGFGGGAGEDQFASFLREEQAKRLVASGGIGLAQSLYEAMVRTSHGQTHD